MNFFQLQSFKNIKTKNQIKKKQNSRKDPILNLISTTKTLTISLLRQTNQSLRRLISQQSFRPLINR